MTLTIGMEIIVYCREFIKQHRCWISEENGAIWAFIGPMSLIILVIHLFTKIFVQVFKFLQINIFFLIATLYQVYKNRQGMTTAEKSSRVNAVK